MDADSGPPDAGEDAWVFDDGGAGNDAGLDADAEPDSGAADGGGSDSALFEMEEYFLDMQSNHGYALRVRAVRPKFTAYPDRRFPVLLRIAGGWGPSNFLLDSPRTREAAARGIVLVTFDSEPKVKERPPSPVLDYNGFKDQDDVALVLLTVLEHPSVDPARAGVWSHSNGITLAAGVLGGGKYPELAGVAFLMDDEGPHCPKEILQVLTSPDDYVTSGIIQLWNEVIAAKSGAGKEYADADAFFAERCASYFVGGFGGTYQRMQALNDHEVKTYHGHAAAMLNAAGAGKAAWTRLNLDERDVVYQSPETPQGVPIDGVIEIDRFENANDERLWNMALDLIGANLR